MKNKQGSGHVSWQRIVLMVLCIVLALVFFVSLFSTIYIQYLLNHITVQNPGTYDTIPSHQMTDPDIDFTAPTMDSTDPRATVPTLPSNPNLAVDGIINIMLIGEDRRPGEDRQRSDSMILCSFDTRHNSLTMISFLRDTYVAIPGYKNQKLNAAYQFRGPNLLNQTLALNFGVHVDANIMVDFTGFTSIIDLLGGVDIELTQKEADYLNKLGGWKLTAGIQHLNGQKALAYSRIRKIDMDAIRAQRQRKVITAIINSYKNKSAGEMLSIATQIITSGFITTDMTTQELTGYVMKLAPMLATASINNQQIPAEGTYENLSVGSLGDCKVIDFDINRKILENIFYKD